MSGIVVYVDLLYNLGMLSPVRELPADWQETTVVKHLAAPYSDAALGEPIKTWIDLGEIGAREWGNIPGRFERVIPATDLLSKKLAGGPSGQLHLRFANAARAILGEDQFAHASVNFLHRQTPVPKGEAQDTELFHLDGAGGGAFYEQRSLASQQVLRLLGVATTTLPSRLIQGATTGHDFSNYGAVMLSAPRDGQPMPDRFTEVELPTKRLVILPPAMPHAARAAESNVRKRTFLRWKLYF